MAHPSMEEMAALIAAVLGGGGVAKLIELRARQRQALVTARAREPADLIRAAGELQQVLTDGGKELMGAFIGEFRFLRGEVSDLRTEATALRDKVEDCETRHAGCEENLAKVTKRLDASEAERAELKAQIDRLLEGPPASY